MSAVFLLPFVTACFLIEITPGPNMAYLAILSATHGRRAGMAAVAGVALGLGLVGLAAALGVGALIRDIPELYHFLRWSGVAYLLWLAWEGWREEAYEGVSSSEASAFAAGLKFFRRGLVTNLLNPKAFVFYVAMLPGFVDVRLPVQPQIFILTLVYVCLATAIHAAIVALAGSARVFLEDFRWRARVRKGLSVALVLVAVWFALTTGAQQS